MGEGLAIEASDASHLYLSQQSKRGRKWGSGYLEPGSREGWEVVQWAPTLKFFQNKKSSGKCLRSNESVFYSTGPYIRSR